MILEIYYYKNFGPHASFVITITVIAFLLAFLANVNSGTDILNSIIALTGTLMGVMLTLLIDIARDKHGAETIEPGKEEATQKL